MLSIKSPRKKNSTRRKERNEGRCMIKKKQKENNLNTRDILLSKNWNRSIRHEIEMRNIMSRSELKELVISWMLDWIAKPEAETILDFCIEYRIPRSTLSYWTANDEEFGRFVDNIKLILSNKLYKLMLHRNCDREAVLKVMHKLDPEWLGIDQYHNDLKKQIASAQQTVVIQTYPSSDLVPPLKD